MLIFWSCKRDIRPIVFPTYFSLTLSARFFNNVLVPKLHFAEVSTTFVFKLSRYRNSTTETHYWTNFYQNILNQKNPSTTKMVFVGSFCHLNKCVISADENRSLQQCRLSNMFTNWKQSHLFYFSAGRLILLLTVSCLHKSWQWQQWWHKVVRRQNYANNNKKQTCQIFSSVLLCYSTSQNLAVPRSARAIKDCKLLLQ